MLKRGSSIFGDSSSSSSSNGLKHSKVDSTSEVSADYANDRCMFVTGRGPGQGTSLYYVTTHWVIRCAGFHFQEVYDYYAREKSNDEHDRIARTFVRRRKLRYGTLPELDDPCMFSPARGLYPYEIAPQGFVTHEGHQILAVLPLDGGPLLEPVEWIAGRQGVPWVVALEEIEDAVVFAQQSQWPKFSRNVYTQHFYRD